MSYTRTKDINGGKYKYEQTAHWDKDKQQSRSTSHYVGVVKSADKDKKDKTESKK